MHRSIAVLFFAFSCASAFPVVFITYEGDKSQGSPKLFDCASVPNSENSVNAEATGLAYRCRPNPSYQEHLKQAHTFPTFEILEEPLGENTNFEVEEISIPTLPLLGTYFPSSKIVIANGDASNANAQYEIAQNNSPSRNKGGCEDDEIFIAELDLCMPHAPQQTAPKTATFNEEQESVPIEPDFTILEVGYAPHKCKEGEIFLPSVGICAPADNCYPFPNCDAYDEAQKEKEKEIEKKNKQPNQRNNEEKDD